MNLDFRPEFRFDMLSLRTEFAQYCYKSHMLMCVGREQSYFEVQTICSVEKTEIMKVLTLMSGFTIKMNLNRTMHIMILLKRN